MHVDLKPIFNFQLTAGEMNVLIKALIDADNPSANSIAVRLTAIRKKVLDEWQQQVEASDAANKKRKQEMKENFVMPKIKPCPTCGAKTVGVVFINEVENERAVVCSDCGKTGPVCGQHHWAIDAWNSMVDEQLAKRKR